jgi:endonuclease YncB( thermonuclease family)
MISQQTLRGALLAAALALIAGHSSAQSLVGRVVGVSDGDTITLLVDGHDQYKVRLSGIDAPEKSQPFGSRAKQRLSDLVYGKTVTALGTKRDRYRRLIAKILVNGRDANLEMVASGYSWHYKKYEGEQPAVDRTAYALAEREARMAKRGLWVDESPVAPWDYRHGGRRAH